MRSDVRLSAAAAALLFSAAVAVPGQAQPPAYTNYVAPAPLGQTAGEPTIGVNWNSGNVMFIASLQTLRVTFDDSVSPATVTWTDVSYPLTSLLTLDPFVFTNPTTGRTIVSQLLGKTSLMAVTDDDGATWFPSLGSGINSGVDHQSVGGGPFAPSLLGGLGGLGGILHPHIFYYCSQDIALAQCSFSLDGGITFGLAVPIYTLLQCGGLHGHVKVGPDGKAFVPNKNCGGQQGVSVSSNNGLSWTVRKVPGTSGSPSDPSVGIADDGTVYMGMVDGGRPKVAVSHDDGRTWSTPVDVGVPHGIQNTVFPTVVAGDPERAAFAFLGTATAGANATADDPTFPGAWHLYVATTYDGGATWTTVNATPGDPVQRGSICTSGTACGSTRNLLDFMGVTKDEEGRVLVAYADGCVGACVSGGPNSYTAIGVIARQSGGKGLFAAYD